MIKYLFFDVDGTLLPFGQDVPLSTRKALNKAFENGHKLFYSTGRGSKELDKKLIDLPFIGGVFAGGARAEINGEVILNNCLTKDQVKDFYTYAKKEDLLLYVQALDYCYITKEIQDKLYKDFYRYNKKDFIIDNIKIVEELPILDTITKILFYSPNSRVNDIKNDLQATFEIIENSLGLPLNDWAEVGAIGLSKDKGMYAILSYYGASKEDAISFGDGFNDIEIIREAGIGVAMGNANDSLKAIADYITSDINDDGIYNALKHFSII